VFSSLRTETDLVSETFYFIVFRIPDDGLKLTLSKGPNTVGVFHPSPEDGNKSSLRNVVFSRFWNSGRWAQSRTQVIISTSSNPTLVYTRVHSYVTVVGAVEGARAKEICNFMAAASWRSPWFRLLLGEICGQWKGAVAVPDSILVPSSHQRDLWPVEGHCCCFREHIGSVFSSERSVASGRTLLLFPIAYWFRLLLREICGQWKGAVAVSESMLVPSSPQRDLWPMVGRCFLFPRVYCFRLLLKEICRQWKKAVAVFKRT
jgi:hypothetical protein